MSFDLITPSKYFYYIKLNKYFIFIVSLLLLLPFLAQFHNYILTKKKFYEA